ncbi:hypothetical protein DS909_08070 [Phaeobacter gallaeciensis]|uniref:Cadherin domain-containing protein n=2 Tax=Phaeobacter gallaeciensis TaxID=60890 RepID=A0A366X1R3_9RHOB|nr:VCBS domain-containing protein [Phaeobacter gallaeciensis]RBW57640.1 hypothetical protein DS909_08070 [Phaeobacter gallaeciensis]
MAENQPILRGQLAATDVDSGDQLRFTAGSLPVGFSISNSGAWSYAPPSGMYDHLRAGETTDLVVPVTVRDPSGASDGRNLVVTIKGTNDKPVVSGTFVGQVKEDRTLRSTGSLQITDADHGEDHFLSGSQVGSYGTLKINASGDWSYDLDNNNRDVQGLHTSDQIVDKFTISTADGSTRQILVTVNGTDDGAQITGVATGSVTEDGTTVAKGKLTVVDPDKGDDQLVPQTGASGAFGAFNVGADGAWSYKVDNGDPSVQGLKDGDVLRDHITVSSVDGTTHQIQITIHGTNDAPVLSATTASATEDGSAVSGQMHATDVDTGDTQKFTLGQAAPAGFTLNANGSWSFDPTDAAYQHLAAGATQQVTVPVTVTDSAGATDTENLVITVTGTNDGPAVSGPVALPGGTEDTAVQITAAQLLDHATDIDTGDQLSVTGLSASNGTIGGDAVHGFTFTPDPNYNGPVSLSYTVTDGHGGTVAQTASLTLAAVGDAAVIGGVDTGSVTEGTAGQDMSPDYAQPGMAHLRMATLKVDGQLTIIDPDAGEAEFDGKGIGFNYQGQFGDLLLNPDGSWHYNADAGGLRFVGGRPTTRGTAIDQLGDGETLTDTITVHSKDGTPHDIVITIHGSNDRPYCSSEVVLRPGAEDTRQTLTSAQLLGNTVDVDANDAGKLAIANLHPDHGSILDNKDGTYTFTPEKDYNGTVHFTYDVKDAHGGVTHTGATTALAAVGDAAVITGTDTGAATEDHVQGRIVINGLLSVSDPDGPSQEHFQYSQFGETAVSDPFGGNLHIDSAGGWSYVTDNSNAAIQQLAAGEDGHATYRVRSTDGTTHQIQITIHGTNDTPVLSAATASATEDGSAVSGQMSTTDVDHGDTQAYSLGQAAPAGFTLNANGSWSFDPTDAAYQHLAAGATQQVTVPVTVTDSAGATDTENLVITVTGTNDGAHIGGVRTMTLTEDTNINTGNTLQTGGVLTVTDVDTGEANFVPQHNVPGTYGTFEVQANGLWVYHVDNGLTSIQGLNAGAHLTDTITVATTDGTTQQIQITIGGTNDAPTLTPALANATEGAAQVSGQISATDVDTGDSHAFSTGATVAGFSLNSDGSWTFDPTDPAYQHLASGQTQVLTIPITVTDGAQATDTDNLVVTVTGSNDGPTVTTTPADLGDTKEDQGRMFTEAELLKAVGAQDPDGDALHITGISIDPAAGHFVRQSSGDWVFAPAHDFHGDHTPISLNISDGTTTTQAPGLLDVTPVTDAAQPDLTISAEQQVMEFDNSSASAIFTREAVHNGGPISSMALEMTVLGGQQVASAGGHGATLVSYETSPNSDQMYVYKPDDMVVRIAGHNYDTQVAVLNDGKDHRYSFLWDGPKGTLDVLIDGQVAKHMDNVAKGLTMPDGGALAFGGDQDSMRGGFDNNDAFAGKMFNAAMATSTVSPSQLATAPLAQVLDGQPSLLTAVQISNGQIVDRTGNYHYDIHGSFTHTTVEVDTKIAPPNPGATLKLTASLGAPSDSDDHIVHARLSGFPTGTVITDGTSAHSVTISANTPDVDIAGWNISGLTAHAPASFHGNFRTTLVVVTQGPDGTQATATTSAPVIFDATQPVPDAKISGDSSATTDEDTSVSGNLTIVDSAGQDHFVAATLSGTLGDLQIQQNGHWTYTPGAKADAMAEGAKAYESFMVKSADGSQHEVHISLQGTNDAPVVTATQSAPADLGEVSTGKTLSFTDAELIQLTGATDIEHEALSVSSVTVDPQYGAFSKAPGGGWTFTPASGVAHEDVVVQIAVSDGHTVTDASGTLDVGFALAVTAISQDTGVSSTDFTTTDNTLVFSGEGIPGHTIYSMLGGGQVTVDPNGHWQIDLTAYSRTPGDYNFKFFDMESKATLSQRVTITHEHPVLVIDNVGGDDLIDSGDHGKPINVTGDAHNVLDGSIVDLEIAGTHYSATVQGGHWTVTVPGSDMSKLADQNLLLNGVLTDVGGGTATAQHHLVVAADPLSLHASVDLKEDAIVTAMGQVFPGQQVGSVNHPGTYQGNFGTLTVAADGLYTYTLDNGAKSIQALLSGTNARDNFLIPITEASGQTHSAVVAVNIEGTDDAPVISGTLAAERAITQGNWTHLHATGSLDVTDADSQSLSVTINGQTWVPGTAAHIDTPSARLSIDPNGDWTYSLVHAGPQQVALLAGARAGIPQHENFDIIATDGEGHIAKEQLVVTVAPDGQDFTLRGEMRAAVTEDVVTSTTGHLDPVGPTGILDETQTYVWAVAPSQSGDHGNFTVDAHGNWHYALDAQNPEVQALGQGDILQDHATIVATDSTGKQISREVTVDVAGSNDVAVVGGHHVGAVTEDGTPIVTGQLVGTDVDKGDTVTFDAQSAAVGTYGTFGIASDGHWTYHLNNQIAATQQLSGGQVETETFTVTARSTDGAIIHQKISVNVSGHEDAPVISGAFSGSVTEDSSSHASATGQVTASDADSGDKPIFVAQSAVIGTYGTFSIDEHGTWNYDLDNSNAATQALNSGSIEHETFQISVHTADGETETHDVQIEVHGTDEGAILPPPPPPPIPVVAQSDDVDAPPAIVDVDLSIASDLPDLPELSPYLVAAGLQNAPSNVGESGPDDTSDPYLGALGVHRSSPVEPHLIDDPTLLNADLDPDGVSDNEEGHSEPLPEIVDDPLDDLPPPDPIIDENT